MSTTDQPTTQSTHFTKPESDRCGIIRVHDKIMRQLMPEITIDACDTQRYLRDNSVFAKLHAGLLLPTSYTIRGIFASHYGKIWDILVESPELPDANSFVGEGYEYPIINPLYCREEDGTVHLVELQTHAQHTIPIKGGIDWLLKSL